MGIKNLNKYLQMNCSNSIKCISLSELSGKKIAIDVSIYLYKYEGEDALVENMYLLLSVIRKYNIIPIFIFDGKAPTEKKALIQKRIDDRTDAQKEYNILKRKLSDADENEKKEIINTMDQLKKKIIYITKEKIDRIKDLIRYYGATYYDAPNEADELCAMLVIKKKVWACLSEDMDMFVYGCSRVLRYLSLLNHSVVLYYYKGILEDLQISGQDFKEICIIAGTDYNTNLNNNLNIFNIFNYHKQYIKNKDKDNNNITFNNWLQTQKEIGYNINIDLIEKIKIMFDLYVKEYLNIYNKIKITNSQIDYKNLQNLLEQDGFIFI
jgi:5'-3' exonuclease